MQWFCLGRDFDEHPLLCTHCAARALHVLAARRELPGRAVLVVHGEHVIEHGAVRRTPHWDEEFHPPPQVAWAPVGRPDVVLRVAAIGKTINSRMLKESPDHGYDANAIRAAGDCRA